MDEVDHVTQPPVHLCVHSSFSHRHTNYWRSECQPLTFGDCPTIGVTAELAPRCGWAAVRLKTKPWGDAHPSRKSLIGNVSASFRDTWEFCVPSFFENTAHAIAFTLFASPGGIGHLKFDHGATWPFPDSDGSPSARWGRFRHLPTLS